MGVRPPKFPDPAILGACSRSGNGIAQSVEVKQLELIEYLQPNFSVGTFTFSGNSFINTAIPFNFIDVDCFLVASVFFVPSVPNANYTLRLEIHNNNRVVQVREGHFVGPSGSFLINANLRLVESQTFAIFAKSSVAGNFTGNEFGGFGTGKEAK